MNSRFPQSQPHIVLITCHDLGRHLACYGVETVQTPNLDRLANEGIKLERAFATASGCSPSRAALATGRYPHSNGVMGLTHPPFLWDLNPGERHVAGMLQRAGYETHLFGFQHVTTQVTRLGFDHLHGFEALHRCDEKALGCNVLSHFQNFLDNAWPARPLYIEINLEEPHRPYDQGGCLPDEECGVFIPGYLPDGPAAHQEMAALQGAIRQGDRAVGEILAALEDVGLEEETLVIFSADHGIAMPRAKCTLYDPGIEIALLMRWPGSPLSGGRSIPELVSNIDVVPTVLEAAGVAVPPSVQGHSMLPLLCGETFIPRACVYAEKTYHSYYDPMRAIRTEGFKYIRNFGTAFQTEVPGDVQQGAIYRQHAELYVSREHPPVELYDLDADPLEQVNLAGRTELAEVERWLDSRLWKWIAETNDPILTGPVPSPAFRRSWNVGRQFIEDNFEEPTPTRGTNPVTERSHVPPAQGQPLG